METITYLYRAYNKDSELCYVGITKNFDIRMNAHKTEKPWWQDEVEYVNVRTYKTRAEAELEESSAIRYEFPKYNELKGKVSPSSLALSETLERLSPAKTRLPLPSSELEYLKTLDEPKIYERAAALQERGWTVSEILKGVKVSPTPVQLRTAIKLTRNRDESRPVPTPPPTRADRKAAREASAVHLTEVESLRLVQLSRQAKKYRPGHPPGHPIFEAKEEYNALIKTLYESGVTVKEMSEAVGVDESNIRRRLR